MARIARGTRNVYGQAIGILVLDTKFARTPGDIGNATTFKFPVVYRRVEGSKIERVVRGDKELIGPFVEAARELEREGVCAITTSCGFLALFQREIAAAVNIPFFSSSLMLVPLVSTMLRPDQKVGVITAHSASLTEAHFNALGWSTKTTPVLVEGMDDRKAFAAAFPQEAQEYDLDPVGEEMVDAAQTLLRRDPSVGAFVLECTNMGTFAHLIQEATGLPVFDIQTFVNFIYEATHRTPYKGFL